MCNFVIIIFLFFQDCPNYDLCRRIFRAGLKNYGYDDDSLMDLDETCNWQRKLPKKKRKQKNPVLKTYSFLLKSPLKSISSNVVFKRPKLRKSVKRLQISDSIMNWSRILTDPENILKQARERKNTEESEDFSDMDIEALNPTYAMINVYNKAIGRTDNSKNRNDRYVIFSRTIFLHFIHHFVTNPVNEIISSATCGLKHMLAKGNCEFCTHL